MPSDKLESFSKRNPALAPLIKKLTDYIAWLNKCDVGEVIPRVAAVHLGISEADAIGLLGLFEQAGLLRTRYDLVCDTTKAVLGSYRSLKEVPDLQDCKFCGREHKSDELHVDFVFEIAKGRTANAAA